MASVRAQHEHRRVTLVFGVHVHRVRFQLAVQPAHRVAVRPHRPLRRPRQRLHAARTARAVRAARAARTRRRPHRPRGTGKSRGFAHGVGTGSRGNPGGDGFRNGGRRGHNGGEARAVGGVDGSRGNSRFLGSGVGSPRGTLDTTIDRHGLDGSGTTEGCRQRRVGGRHGSARHGRNRADFATFQKSRGFLLSEISTIGGGSNLENGSKDGTNFLRTS